MPVGGDDDEDDQVLMVMMVTMVMIFFANTVLRFTAHFLDYADAHKV